MGFAPNDLAKDMINRRRYRMDVKNFEFIKRSICVRSKQARALMRNLVYRSTNVMINFDIFVPIQTESVGENRYFLTMITTPQSYCNVELLMHRNEAWQHNFNYSAKAVRICGRIVMMPHTENILEHLAMKEN